MLLDNLQKRKLIQCPDFLVSNTHYLTTMGSYAYGVNIDNSDMDVYGWCIPRKETVFPHLNGYILGFGKQPEKFEQWQQHHIFDQDALGNSGRTYDISVYGIVRYFQLLMENNPNILDSIFTDRDCVLHSTQVSELVRENRKLFVHKGLWFKFKGYAFAQMHKIRTKEPEGKRKETIERFGHNTKYSYHLVRLLCEAEQLLQTGEMNLRLNNEHYKAIRKGEVSLVDIEDWFKDKELQLEKLYHESKIQHSPPEEKIKDLLLRCLESHYGSIEKAIERPNNEKLLLQQIKQLVKDY